MVTYISRPLNVSILHGGLNPIPVENMGNTTLSPKPSIGIPYIATQIQ